MHTDSTIVARTDFGIYVDITPVDAGLTLSGADDVLCLATNTVTRVQFLFCVLGSAAQNGTLSLNFHFSLCTEFQLCFFPAFAIFSPIQRALVIQQLSYVDNGQPRHAAGELGAFLAYSYCCFIQLTSTLHSAQFSFTLSSVQLYTSAYHQLSSVLLLSINRTSGHCLTVKYAHATRCLLETVFLTPVVLCYFACTTE